MKIVTSIGKFDIPLHPSEIKCVDWAKFQAKEQVFFEANEEEKLGEHHVSHLIDCVATLIPNAGDLPYSVEGDNLIELINSDFRITVGEPISLERVYVHIINMVSGYNEMSKILTDTDGNLVDYENEEFYFDWEGERYYILPKDVIALGDEITRVYTASEVIMVMEMQRKFTNILNKKGVEYGDLFAELSITEITFLARKKGERIPLNERQRKAWKNRRKNQLEHLTLDRQLQVQFFFRNIYLTYIAGKSIPSLQKNSHNTETEAKVLIQDISKK